MHFQSKRAASVRNLKKLAKKFEPKDVKLKKLVFNKYFIRPKRKLSNVKQLIVDDTIISDDKLIAESS